MTDEVFGWSGVMLIAAVLACGTSDSGTNGLTSPDGTATPSSAADWRPLFDGKTTAGWRGYHQKTMPGGWQAVNGALTRVSQGGDIITNDQFGDFELELEWQISEGGNSGIMYRVSEEGDEAYYTGPEYQVLDNGRHADGKNPLTSAASDYGLYAPVKDVTRPVGEWNAARIVVKGNHVEHWLNSVKVVEYELGSADWQQRVDGSKFKEWPNYGRIPKGHIALQDHGSRVAYRNIRIR
jgi:hypothetical protein